MTLEYRQMAITENEIVINKQAITKPVEAKTSTIKKI